MPRKTRRECNADRFAARPTQRNMASVVSGESPPPTPPPPSSPPPSLTHVTCLLRSGLRFLLFAACMNAVAHACTCNEDYPECRVQYNWALLGKPGNWCVKANGRNKGDSSCGSLYGDHCTQSYSKGQEVAEEVAEVAIGIGFIVGITVAAVAVVVAIVACSIWMVRKAAAPVSPQGLVVQGAMPVGAQMAAQAQAVAAE